MSEITERKARQKVQAALGAAALLLGSVAIFTLTSAIHAQAATAISVFVGYADSDRAGGEFPNPWNGALGVEFDGCSPQSACTFDGGAIRVRNDNTVAVMVDQLSVHIGTCTYTWSGPMYPVSLAPGAALITTQRGSGVAAGCTGPDPVTFDSSDIPNAGTCVADGIVPVVDVAVDGVTTSYTDSGQVLNSGGVDPGACSNSDESTQWTRIGSKPCPGETLALVPVTQTDSVGTTATLTAALTDGCGNGLADVAVAFKVTAGPNAALSGSGVTNDSGNATFSYSSSVTGTDTLQAAVTNAVGFTRASNSATVTWTVEFAPGGGAFVIGNNNATAGSAVNFWGSQWSQHNPLATDPAPRSFKGFADQPDVPACGKTWTSEPGNSTPPPDGPLPEFMAVIVTSSVRQIGPELTGDIVGIVVVRTNRGYEPNPGHWATGVVVGVICGAVSAPTSAVPKSTQAPNTPAHVASGAPPSSSSSACAVAPRGKSVPNAHRKCLD
ncbi:MAG TPA: Ig-like domain-containing protein [Candidatus Dormibacteraeota bacterium]|nr:Ig-like domain-containing protein [Candidatus Dormibacteraeota bacterium]